MRYVSDDEVLGKIYDLVNDINDTIDAVEVIRCRDCKHRCTAPIVSKIDPHWCLFAVGDCPIVHKTVKDDDYCAWAERKEQSDE